MEVLIGGFLEGRLGWESPDPDLTAECMTTETKALDAYWRWFDRRWGRGAYKGSYHSGSYLPGGSLWIGKEGRGNEKQKIGRFRVD